jgi:hypothetical protein
MATKKKTTKKKTGGKKVGFGLAAALVGAVATGLYLSTPKGKAKKEKAKAWTIKAKGEVLEQFEKKKVLTKEQYNQIVDTVTTKYSKLKSVGGQEAGKLNKELKRHWKEIKQATKENPKK